MWGLLIELPVNSESDNSSGRLLSDVEGKLPRSHRAPRSVEADKGPSSTKAVVVWSS